MWDEQFAINVRGPFFMAQRFVPLMRHGGAQVHNPKVWPTRPISIDDTRFVLLVTTTPEGQAAVADLGAVRLAIYGSAIPDDLALRLSQLDSISFEADPDEESDG